MNFSTRTTTEPEQSISTECIFLESQAGTVKIPFDTPEGATSFVAALTRLEADGELVFDPKLSVSLKLVIAGEALQNRDNDSTFIDEKLAVLTSQLPKHLIIQVESKGGHAFALQIAAYMAAKKTKNKAKAATTGGTGPKTPLKCALCKAGAAAVATAIAATSAFAVIPKAVVALVAAKIGAGITAAAVIAFIKSLAKTTVSSIQTAICTKLKMCP